MTGAAATHTHVTGASLVALQPLGSKTPVVCVHAQAGDLRLYANLARRLGPDRQVYGLQARGLEGACDPPGRFEDMAALYAAELRRALPERPLVVVGECLGAGVAYELAQQLRTSGEDVPLLALIDAFRPGLPQLRRFVPAPAQQVVHRARILGFHAGNLWRLPPRRKFSYATERANRAAAAAHARVSTLRGRLPPRTRVRQAFDQALADYRPEPYGGPVTLLRAEQLPAWVKATEDLGWRELAANLEVVRLPGYFTTPISVPSVLAAALAARLERLDR